MKQRHFLVASLIVFLFCTISFAQTIEDKADVNMVNRIWDEETTNSQVMEILSYLSDVIGPRIPGSPAMKKAQDWTTQKLGE